MKIKDLQFIGSFKGHNCYIDGTQHDASDLHKTITRTIEELDKYRKIENDRIFNEKYPEKGKTFKGILIGSTGSVIPYLIFLIMAFVFLKNNYN